MQTFKQFLESELEDLPLELFFSKFLRFPTKLVPGAIDWIKHPGRSAVGALWDALFNAWEEHKGDAYETVTTGKMLGPSLRDAYITWIREEGYHA